MDPYIATLSGYRTTTYEGCPSRMHRRSSLYPPQQSPWSSLLWAGHRIDHVIIPILAGSPLPYNELHPTPAAAKNRAMNLVRNELGRRSQVNNCISWFHQQQQQQTNKQTNKQKPDGFYGLKTHRHWKYLLVLGGPPLLLGAAETR